jgi:hypothetical protein
MKQRNTFFLAMAVLVVISALFRLIPSDMRPLGFAPQIAIALFGGALITDKKYAFALPLLSMFISDVIFELLHINGLSNIGGFYSGQLINYAILSGITVIGFFLKKITVPNVLAYSLIAPTFYFIVSNFSVWVSGGGFSRPKTLNGMLMAYNDGLPFYPGSIAATIVFSAILFGGYYLVKKQSYTTVKA